jgi:stress response protein YsnF
MAPTPLSSQLKDIQKAANDAKNELKNMLGSASGLERDAIKATKAYKDQLKILKEANEQVAEIKRNHTLTTEALIQQEGKLKGL